MKLIRDTRASALAKSVYAELLANAERPVVRVGQRLIAARIGAQAASVGKALKELATLEYLEILAVAAGKRQSYRLLPVEGVAAVASGIKPAIRSVPNSADRKAIKEALDEEVRETWQNVWENQALRGEGPYAVKRWRQRRKEKQGSDANHEIIGDGGASQPEEEAD